MSTWQATLKLIQTITLVMCAAVSVANAEGSSSAATNYQITAQSTRVETVGLIAQTNPEAMAAALVKLSQLVGQIPGFEAMGKANWTLRREAGQLVGVVRNQNSILKVRVDRQGESGLRVVSEFTTLGGRAQSQALLLATRLLRASNEALVN